MKVKFHRDFFIDGYEFRKGVEEVPDQFRDRLPSTAEVLDEEQIKAEVKAEAKTKAKAKPEPKTLADIGKELGLDEASTEIA